MKLNVANVGLSESKAKDFIDAKYHLLDNLDDLESVVQLNQLQNEEAQLKLQESTRSLRGTLESSLSAAEDLLSAAGEAALNRHALADDLSSLYEELTITSITATGNNDTTFLEELEGLQLKLEQLELARTYIRLVERAINLSEDAVKTFRSSKPVLSSFDGSALAGYIHLQDFITSVKESCKHLSDHSVECAEDNSLEILAFLESTRDRSWKAIKSILSTNLLTAAEQIKWPMKVDYASLPHVERTEFENAFTNLLQLEEFGLKVHNKDKCSGSGAAPKQPEGLYPLQALVQPIVARFKFHFEGTRPTNRLDKPEFYFTHILNVIHEHRSFIEVVLQPLVTKNTHKPIIATQEFIYLLLPILSRKIRRTVPALLQHPALLAHTVYQTLIFDSSLRDQGFTTLVGTSGVGLNKSLPFNDDVEGDPDEWEGLSAEILGNKEWFDAWLLGEQKFADSVYNEIISSPDAWQLIDDDSNKGLARTGDEDLKPTTSARRVKALIEQVTDRYHPLPRFAHKTHFLITIQVPILESYLERISSSLDAYETLSSSFMRAVPGALAGQFGTGVDTKRLTSGTEGLKRLLKAYASANWIKDAMESWGEELFFLELWSEINKRSALRARAAAHTSLPSKNAEPSNSTEGTLFDELIAHYGKLLVRADDMMIKQVCYEVESDLKPYTNAPWGDIAAVDAELSSPVPAELVKPLSVYSSSLNFFTTTSFPSSHVTTAYKRIVANITHHLIQRIVHQRSKGRFTSRWGKEFAQHCKYWVQTSELALATASASGSGKVRRPAQAWDRLADTATLLSVDEADLHIALLAIDYGPDKYASIKETLGLSGALKWEEAKDVVRARVDGFGLGR